MKSYFAYTRVSTTRQGEEGVSLQEQKRAILEYASRRGITVTEWFEEQVSAAKKGRPIFSKLVSTLKARKEGGLIIHKIDRSARNLWDWANMAELMDRGIEVHFAHESIDLHTRSGRLSADILAVVASDYIRNLREETLKGIEGRLRQGLFPFAAPVGYLNNGGGKAKTVDPVRGLFVQQAFELYSTTKYSLHALEDEMFERGFRTSSGKRVSLNQLNTILRNPFYMGLIRLKERKDTYPGIHEPLIPSSLYNRVQFILDRKRSRFRQPHRYVFSKLIQCENCRLFLVAETQKGHTYYRCHRRSCPRTCIREERLEIAIIEALKKLNLSPDEAIITNSLLRDFSKREAEILQKFRREHEEKLEGIEQSIRTLLQRFLDNAISKDLFDTGHGPLLMERKLCEERMSRLNADRGVYKKAEMLLGLLRSICETFCTAEFERKRGITSEIFSTVTATGKDTVRPTLTPLMEKIAKRDRLPEGWKTLFAVLVKELTLDISLGSNLTTTTCLG